jgi:hypothetical protein
MRREAFRARADVTLFLEPNERGLGEAATGGLVVLDEARDRLTDEVRARGDDIVGGLHVDVVGDVGHMHGPET